MSTEEVHEFFKGYRNDPDLFFDKADFKEFVYDKEWVDRYIEKQKARNRLVIGIFLGEDIIGEVKFTDIVEGVSASFQITLKNDSYKNKSYGTAAEKLVIDYAFNELIVQTLYADALVTNTRSCHVLEKVGFTRYKEDEKFKFYMIKAPQ